MTFSASPPRSSILLINTSPLGRLISICAPLANNGELGANLAGFFKVANARRALQKRNDLMKQKFDVVIIGGGNAGFGVSAVAHEAGKSIAFIEERDFGGTCPNRGCTPKT